MTRRLHASTFLLSVTLVPFRFEKQDSSHNTKTVEHSDPPASETRQWGRAGVSVSWKSSQTPQLSYITQHRDQRESKNKRVWLQRSRVLEQGRWSLLSFFSLSHSPVSRMLLRLFKRCSKITGKKTVDVFPSFLYSSLSHSRLVFYKWCCISLSLQRGIILIGCHRLPSVFLQTVSAE